MHASLLYADARCALGDELDECVANLLRGRQRIQQLAFDALEDPVNLPFYSWRSPSDLLSEQEQAPYDILQSMLQAALEAQPLSADERRRTGLFVGSSSYDVNVSETRYREQLKTSADAVPMPCIGYGKTAARLQRQFQLGPHIQSYSTACTSSANALLNAHRMLHAGVIDYAFVFGLELFNQTTLLGFHGLSLISPSHHMRPFATQRDGLILGEGCGLIMLTRNGGSPIQLCGGATSTDNHSLTAANTDGSSVAQVIDSALRACGIDHDQVNAVKVHGTASLMSDEAEVAGMANMAPSIPPLFALKPYIGHTLGACGALEAALVFGCLKKGRMPFNAGNADSDLGISLLQTPNAAEPGYYCLNYFAFGGNNTSLIQHKAAR